MLNCPQKCRRWVVETREETEEVIRVFRFDPNVFRCDCCGDKAAGTAWADRDKTWRHVYLCEHCLKISGLEY